MLAWHKIFLIALPFLVLGVAALLRMIVRRNGPEIRPGKASRFHRRYLRKER